MTEDKIKQLFLHYQECKDIQVRNEIFEQYTHLAEIISKKFSKRGVDWEDLYQVGCIALLESIDRFELHKGAQFQTFASTTIIGKIKNYLRDKSTLIRLPRKNFELLGRISKSKAELTQTLGRIPNVSEIAHHIGVDEDIVLESLDAQYHTDFISLDSLVSTEQDDTLEVYIGKEDAAFKAIEDIDFINSNLIHFDEIEKKVLYERFYNERTQSEIAKLLNVSQMHVSRVERKILQKLQSSIKR